MNDDDIIKLKLAMCIAHLLEYGRDGGASIDLIAAQSCLIDERVQQYLLGIDAALLPVPRDGMYPLTFPDPGAEA